MSTAFKRESENHDDDDGEYDDYDDGDDNVDYDDGDDNDDYDDGDDNVFRLSFAVFCTTCCQAVCCLD